MCHPDLLRKTCLISLGMLCIASAVLPQAAASPLLPARTVPTSLTHPTQMSISPQGDRFVIADPFANRVTVFDSRAAELWSAGKNVSLARPHGVVMSSSNSMLFSQLDTPGLYLATEAQSTTVAPLADSLQLSSTKTVIRKIYQLRDQSFLLLTEKPTQLLAVDPAWKESRVLVKGGSGRGMLNSPSACTELPGSRIVVTGGGDFPVQFFDLKGKLITVADWNSITPGKSWNASGCALDQKSRLWVADLTNAQFRLYDLTGTLLETRAFVHPLMRPVDFGVLSDGHLVVANEDGTIHLYEVNQD